MSLEVEIGKLAAVVGRLAEGVEKLTIRVAGAPTAESVEVLETMLKLCNTTQEKPEPEPEPVKPEPEAVEPVKPARRKPAPAPAPVEDAMDPQPTFDKLDELRRVSIGMLKIDGKALREIYKRVGGSEKLSELPLHVHGEVIKAIAAWREEAGK